VVRFRFFSDPQKVITFFKIKRGRNVAGSTTFAAVFDERLRIRI